MVKEQKRGNREIRKPKAVKKPEPVVAGSPTKVAFASATFGKKKS